MVLYDGAGICLVALLANRANGSKTRAGVKTKKFGDEKFVI